MSVSSSSSIYVGNLPPQLDESSLAAYFTPFGDIISISVPSTSTSSGKRNKGFGFITFSTEDDALDALDNMNLNSIGGRTIHVNLADPSKVKEAGAGNKAGRAVWDNEDWLKQYAANDQDPAATAPSDEQEAFSKPQES
ncbi:related to ribonucleoprotein [Ustilago trichophora]|uniref:Related to ribonucleoprotein n=1 Tax=Ustilago trichophora TaxID=86804 RepID=A0A5C3E7E7_9BASI|nr:related to ribonucleoprotein [Ustilago trichophora]